MLQAQSVRTLAQFASNLPPRLSGEPGPCQVPFFLGHEFVNLLDLFLEFQVVARLVAGSDNGFQMRMLLGRLPRAAAQPAGTTLFVPNQVDGYGNQQPDEFLLAGQIAFPDDLDERISRKPLG